MNLLQVLVSGWLRLGFVSQSSHAFGSAHGTGGGRKLRKLGYGIEEEADARILRIPWKLKYVFILVWIRRAQHYGGGVGHLAS